MPTRQEYDEYYKPLIGWELDAYERKSEEMNKYEKTRNRNYRPLAEASLEERSKMENMMAKELFLNLTKKILIILQMVHILMLIGLME